MEDISKEKKDLTKLKLSIGYNSIIGEKFIVREMIDQGSFGKVYVVEDRNDRAKKYAMKVLMNVNPKNLDYFKKEIDILKSLQGRENQYIPKLYYYKTTSENKEEGNYYIIDIAENGDLFPYIIYGRPFPEKFAKYIFKKIIQGIKYCHDCNICNLDIKIENILLDKTYNPLITDFGYSKKISKNNQRIFLNGSAGTDYTKCPQMYIKENYYGDEADIFSLGATLFYLVVGEKGFEKAKIEDNDYKYICGDNQDRDSYIKSVNSRIKYDIVLSSFLSQEFKDLYFSMISFEPSKRPSLVQILNSSWLKEINDLENNNEEYKKFLSEYKNFMDELYEKYKDYKTLQMLKVEGNMAKQNTRNILDEKNGNYFNIDTKLKKLSENKMIPNYAFKIKGYIEPVKLMNKLCSKIKEKYGDKSKITPSKKSLKFDVIFINDENEKQNDDDEEEECEVKIKLYEADKDEYILHFVKKEGDFKEFYEHFIKAKEFII